MLYERTALSKKPTPLIERELAALRTEDRFTPDLVFPFNELSPWSATCPSGPRCENRDCTRATVTPQAKKAVHSASGLSRFSQRTNTETEP